MVQDLSWGGIAWRILAIYGPVTLLGTLVGQLSLSLVVAMALHLAWMYRNQRRLANWLNRDRSLTPPTGRGSWESIFHGVYRLQARNRGRRRELARVIRRFREGAEALPDAAVVFRIDGTIIWCNKLSQQILGFRWPEDNGQNIANLIRHPTFISYLYDGNYDEPLEMPSPVNPQRALELRIMRYTQGQCLMVVRDISRVRDLERVRRKFVANVSHELRTPLTVLRGYLEMMEDEPPEPLIWSKAHQTMSSQAERMNNLVNQLLTLSRIEAAPDVDLHEKVDMPTLLELIRTEAVALSGEARHHVKLQLETQDWVYGNRDQLHSAIGNLVSNAVRYTPDGGDITIRWQREINGAATLSVRDNGPGIPGKFLARLTERFYRVDKARSRDTGGSGLGLAIVKHALNHHNSRLDIQSQVGRGSCFSFTLPASMVIDYARSA